MRGNTPTDCQGDRIPTEWYRRTRDRGDLDAIPIVDDHIDGRLSTDDQPARARVRATYTGDTDRALPDALMDYLDVTVTLDVAEDVSPDENPY